VISGDDKERVKRARVAGLRISTEGTPQAFIDLAKVAEEFLLDRRAPASTATTSCRRS